jgi:hypothetical protein
MSLLVGPRMSAHLPTSATTSSMHLQKQGGRWETYYKYRYFPYPTDARRKRGTAPGSPPHVWRHTQLRSCTRAAHTEPSPGHTPLDGIKWTVDIPFLPPMALVLGYDMGADDRSSGIKADFLSDFPTVPLSRKEMEENHSLPSRLGIPSSSIVCGVTNDPRLLSSHVRRRRWAGAQLVDMYAPYN